MSDLERGQQHEAAGDLSRAIECYERAAHAGELDAEILLGYVLVDAGDQRAAEAAFLSAARKGSALAMSNLGGQMMRRGALDQAEEWLVRALDLGYAGAGMKLGELFHRGGDLAKAEQAFLRADELGDEMAAYNVGIILRDRGEGDLAEVAWRRAFDRGSAPAALQLAGAASRRGDEDASEHWLRRGGELRYNRQRRDDWLTRTPREEMSSAGRERASRELGRWSDDIARRGQAALDNNNDFMDRYAIDAEFAHVAAVMNAHAEAASRMTTAAVEEHEALEMAEAERSAAVVHNLRLLNDGSMFRRLVVLPGKSVLGYNESDSIALRVPWSELERIEIEGPAETHRRVTATRIVALGPFAWAAKKHEKRGFIVIGTATTELIFQTSLTPYELRAQLASATSSLHQRAGSAPAATEDIVRQLSSLTDMHAAGALTDNEFNELKTRLIEQST